eukprot:6136003-Amphidinium_carterae.1
MANATVTMANVTTPEKVLNYRLDIDPEFQASELFMRSPRPSYSPELEPQPKHPNSPHTNYYLFVCYSVDLFVLHGLALSLARSVFRGAIAGLPISSGTKLVVSYLNVMDFLKSSAGLLGQRARYAVWSSFGSDFGLKPMK